MVTSPLRRAVETAAAFGVTADVDERWIELDYGELDGQPISSIAPQVWEQWRSDPTRSPGGGEPLARSARVREACTDLLGDAAAGTVVVVTHVSPIKAAIAWALAVPDDIAWRMYVEDASISRIDVDSTGPSLRWFNRLAPTP